VTEPSVPIAGTDVVAVEPDLPEFAPRLTVDTCARLRCRSHPGETPHDEGFLDAGGVSCARVVCGSEHDDPDENVLGWYVVPRLA